MSTAETLSDSPAAAGLTRVQFIRWLRKMHGWIGLWGATLGLLFGSSGILLNHRAVMKIDAVRSQESTVQLALPQPAPQSAQGMAEWLRDYLNLDHPNLKSREEKAHPVAWGDKDLTQPAHWQMSLTTPRMNVQADWWVGSAFVTLKRSDNNFFAVLGNLHKGVGLGVAWVLLVDTLAGSIILLSLSGVVLWTQLNRRRVVGAVIGIASLVLTLVLSLQAMYGMAIAHHGAPAWRDNSGSRRWPAIAAIVALHGAGLYAALQIGAVRERIAEAAPLFVSFISAAPAPQVQAPPPKPEPVKLKVEQHLIASPKPTASAMQAPPEPVHQEPVADPTPPAPPAPPAPAEAAPVTPPNFVAAYLDNPAPEYPRLSRRLKESGTVLLRVEVNAAGRAGQVELNKSSGYERLDQAAQDAVRKWRFVPAKQGDQAVAAWVIVPINFQLDQ